MSNVSSPNVIAFARSGCCPRREISELSTTSKGEISIHRRPNYIQVSLGINEYTAKYHRFTNMANPETTSQGFLNRAYGLKSTSEASTLYDEWAAKYDQHLTEMNYIFPGTAVNALTSTIGNSSDHNKTKILDAGCGTGLVGVILSQNGFRTIDGLDISKGMLEQAKKTGSYRSLWEADLTKPIECADQTYDVVICVGTFTKGHVGHDPALMEFLRVIRREGLVVATVIDEVWNSGGFKEKVDELARAQKVAVLRSESIGVTEGETEGGRLLVLRKL